MQTNFEMKKNNTLKIFRELRMHAPLSRKELEAATELSWGSVSSICNELLQKQFIVAEKESADTGRPPEKLNVHPSKNLYLGIDINSVGLSFNLLNLGGKSVYSAFLPIVDRDKDALLESIKQQVTQILNRFNYVIGINLSMQGTIDKKAGVSVRTNFFENWNNVPLVEFFQEQFHLPTYLYHDPECLLTYHLHNDSRLRGMKNGIVVRIDEGIGMAQLIHGKIYNAGDDCSCELGHTIAVPHGRVCTCGKQGCLESYASLRGMKQIYWEETGKNPDNFIQLMLSQDKTVAEIRKNAATHLGIALANLFTLSAPSFIMLDGILIAQAPHFFEEIKAETANFYQGDCNLLRAFYKKDAPAIGASIFTTENQLEDILFHDSLYTV